MGTPVLFSPLPYTVLKRIWWEETGVTGGRRESTTREETIYFKGEIIPLSIRGMYTRSRKKFNREKI